jgi:hypothetical protein
MWDTLIFTQEGLTNLAHKTYVPHLRFVLNVAYQYGTRYQTQLASTLTSPQMACLVSVLAALAECLQLLGPTPIIP